MTSAPSGMPAPSGTPTLAGMVPGATQARATVVEQVAMARDTYRLRLRCPELAGQIRPGQFFMVRDASGSDPLLGRPFALYDVFNDDSGRPVGVDFGYVVVGKLTRRMSQWRPGDCAELWGPLGNGFPLPPSGHLMMVAGGIGQTPFLAVAREALGLRRYPRPGGAALAGPVARATLCYGVRSAEYLAGLDDFRMPGLEARVATDDGTFGHHGYVTDLLAQALERSEDRPDAIYCCGPEPMMHAVGKLAARQGVSCWLSLETPMACGFGACFSCVTRVKLEDGTWDYRRTCVEGPVFPAERLVL